MTWTTDDVTAVASARELEITTARVDGTLRPWTPIWVVRVADELYVRTWHRRDTGWYGRALRSAAARVRAAGVEADVLVQDVGEQLRAEVDAAYYAKYGRDSSTERMVGDEAAATTLTLVCA